MTTALIRRIPDIGETFTITDRWSSHRYRVTGWLRRRGRLLVWCHREQAEFVTGTGVCGIIRPVSDVVVDGRVRWPESWIWETRCLATRLIGQSVR